MTPCPYIYGLVIGIYLFINIIQNIDFKKLFNIIYQNDKKNQIIYKHIQTDVKIGNTYAND